MPDTGQAHAAAEHTVLLSHALLGETARGGIFSKRHTEISTCRLPCRDGGALRTARGAGPAPGSEAEGAEGVPHCPAPVPASHRWAEAPREKPAMPRQPQHGPPVPLLTQAATDFERVVCGASDKIKLKKINL